MDTPAPLAAQLQQAWLNAQVGKDSSPFHTSPSITNPFSPPLWTSPALDPASPPLLYDFSQPWPELASGASLVPHSFGASTDPSSDSVSSGGTTVPEAWAASSTSASGSSGAAADSWPSADNQVDNSTPGMSSSDDDISMNPPLEYVSDMLMDDTMEDKLCMWQECTAFQAIANGFYEILAQNSSLRPAVNEPSEDFNWVDAIWSTEPMIEEHTATGESTITSADSSETDVRSLPLDSSSGTHSLSQKYPTLNAVSQDSGVRNGGVFPDAASTPSQAYPPSTVSNFSAPSVLSASEFPALHDILYRGDFGVGSSFSPDVSSQPHHNRSEDEKFRKARSEKVLRNGGQHRSQMNGVAGKGSGVYRRSESTTESRRLSQEEAKMTGGIDHVGGKMSDRSFSKFSVSQAQDTVEGQMKKGNPSEYFVRDMNPKEYTPVDISDEKVSFVKNEYLKAEKVAKMYEECSDCSKLGAHSNGTSGKRTDKVDAVDLRGLLVSCAQAMAGNELRRANEILQQIQHHATPTGTKTQRLAHYFAEALVARLSGTGGRLYTAIANSKPSAAKMLRAYRIALEYCPFLKLTHYFANHSILEAAEGASRLHIVDYGILYGIQWPSLISALANRSGGPPFLRITGIEFPQPGLNPAQRVEETGCRLAEYAREYNVPFEFRAIASQWEDVEPPSLRLQKGELLVVNCVYRLRNLLDETVMIPSPRDKVLSRMRSINPDLLVVGVMNAGFNAPFFVTRFREALYHFSCKFDMSDIIGSDLPERVMIEREIVGRDILNVVACEGPERVERPETCRQWQARLQRAGFEPLPPSRVVIAKARHVIECYDRNYGIDENSIWMMLGWKGRVMQGLSKWKPSLGAASH